MRKIRQLSVCISTVFLLGFSSSSFADDCRKYRHFLEKQKFDQIISEVSISETNPCILNILGLAHYDKGSQQLGLEILSKISINNYAPAIYNVASLVSPDVYDARQRLVLYREALSASFHVPEFRQTFLNSWESGAQIIKSCTNSTVSDCKSLREDTALSSSFVKIGSDFFEQLNTKHISDKQFRRNVEEGILGLAGLAAYFTTKNLPKNVPVAPTKPLPGSAPTNAMGMDQKTFLCVMGHISSGARNSVCT